MSEWCGPFEKANVLDWLDHPTKEKQGEAICKQPKLAITSRQCLHQEGGYQREEPSMKSAGWGCRKVCVWKVKKIHTR